ncbi:MAG: 5'/3'-nucleotidase SurE [Dehalococcoidia bacterium]|nr:5'/3'-nucleotidase SurE [Dehalococcoidia bacterium]
MNIVVTNDDGLHTSGIWALARALCAVGHVTVVAPDREQSGVGMGISFTRPVKVEEMVSRIEGVKALAVEGTPADAVILAVQGFSPGPVDLVVSGINEGANLGQNVLVSGTVGACFQAHFWNIPAIAVSVATLKGAQFDPAAQTAAHLATLFRDGVLTGPLLLNVNLPNVPLAEIKGVSITRLAKGKYFDTLEKVPSHKHDYYWLARGKSEWAMDEGTDAWAMKQKHISITPLHMDLTAETNAPHLDEVLTRLRAGLRG